MLQVSIPEARPRMSHKRERLTKRSQYVLVQRRGRVYADPLLSLRALPNRLEVIRFGFAVGKGVGRAVVRNRVRRRLREITRQTPVKPGWDLVFAARGAAATADFHALRTSVKLLLAKAGLLQESSAATPTGRE